MYLSRWCITEAATRRLRRYNASDIYCNVSPNASDLWKHWSDLTYAVVKDTSIILNSGHNFRGTAPIFSAPHMVGAPCLALGIQNWMCRALVRWQRYAERREREAIHKRAKAAAHLPLADGTLLTRDEFLSKHGFDFFYRDNPTATLQALENLSILGNLHSVSDSPFYLEIGAGAGLTAAGMVLNHSAQAVIIDLPQTVNVAYAIISSVLPELRLVLPNESTREKLDGKDFDILFIQPEQVDMIRNLKFDVVLSANSFQEMRLNTIRFYFSLIYKVMASRGVFYCKQLEKSKYIEDADIMKYPWSERYPIILNSRSEMATALAGLPVRVMVQRAH